MTADLKSREWPSEDLVVASDGGEDIVCDDEHFSAPAERGDDAILPFGLLIQLPRPDALDDGQ